MKAPFPGNNLQRGLSTLEVLIAFAILTLSIVATVMVLFGSQSLAIDTQTNIESLGKAESQIEVARATARANFSSVGSIAPTADDIYSKKLTVTDVDSSTKQVTSEVDWGSGGRNLYTQLSTILTNWLQPADKCNIITNPGWKNPQVIGFYDFPSPGGATGLFVAGKKVYVVSDPTSATKDDFYAVDARDLSDSIHSLSAFSSFHTSDYALCKSTPASICGLTSIVVNGRYAYVTVDSAKAQLFVIDLLNYADLTSSSIIKHIDFTSAGDAAVGNTVTYADGELYVGLTKSNGAEFQVLSVSNPAFPAPVGTYEVGAGINKIVIQGTTAYLATDDTNKPLIALDVSNPANPTPSDSYNSAPSVLFGQSIAIDANTNTLYFGRKGANDNPKFFGFAPNNISTPTWTVDLDKKSGVYTMISRSNLLFMTTADPNRSFQIWNTSSNPPALYTLPLSLEEVSTAGSDCAGNYIYVGERSQHAMQIIGPS